MWLSGLAVPQAEELAASFVDPLNHTDGRFEHIIGRSCDNILSREKKSKFVEPKTRLLSQQKYACRAKTRLLSGQKYFVARNIIL